MNPLFLFIGFIVELYHGYRTNEHLPLRLFTAGVSHLCEISPVFAIFVHIAKVECCCFLPDNTIK